MFCMYFLVEVIVELCENKYYYINFYFGIEVLLIIIILYGIFFM